MAVFEYRGLVVASGKQVSGVRDADNPKALRASLKREGILITQANESSDESRGKRRFDLLKFFRRTTPADVAMMTRQLATLVAAGIALPDSVAALTESMDKPELQRVLTEVRDQLNEGTSFAKSLGSHPHVFPPLYVNMVAAGEESGTLDQVLSRLADYMENQAKLRSKVSAAMAYPILMGIFGVVLIGTMMTVVVPKVTSIFATLDRALPWYTATLIFVSGLFSSTYTMGAFLAFWTLFAAQKALKIEGARAKNLSTWGRALFLAFFVAFISGIKLLGIRFPSPPLEGPAGWRAGFILLSIVFLFAGLEVESTSSYAIGAAGGLVGGFAFARFVAWTQAGPGRLWRDGMMLKLPLFGVLLTKIAISRFSKTLATLLQSGVPLLKALEIVRSIIGNAKLEKVIEDASTSVREGSSLAQPLKRSGEFDPLVVRMIAVGEKSGALESMLENVARAYDTEVEARVQAMTSLLEPLMIVFMGGSVGFIAFSIMMPLIQMNEFVQ